MKKYICTACEWVYDPAVGDPDGGIAPGTPFEDIPDDWVCPICLIYYNILSSFDIDFSSAWSVFSFLISAAPGI